MRIIPTEKIIALAISKIVPDVNIGYGNRLELHKFLANGKALDHQNFIISTDEKNYKQYPLIWIVGSILTDSIEDNLFLAKKARIIFSVNNACISDTNDQREVKSYSILSPIAEKAIERFTKSQLVGFEDKLNPKYSFFREPNYSENQKENATIDIWDALVIDTNLILNTNCLTHKELIECRN